MMASPNLAEPTVLDVSDSSPDFCRLVSLLAALEGAVGMAGHAQALPYLGMARAELVDFGHRRPAYLLAVEVVDVASGLRELQDLIDSALLSSNVLPHSLRLDAASRHIDRILQGQQ